LPFIIPDQLSALKKEKIGPREYGARLTRFYDFMDAVLVEGFTCLYDQEMVKAGRFKEVYETLKLKEDFVEKYLTPHGIRIEYAYKELRVKESQPWLKMPVMIVTDEVGIDHQIAISNSHRIILPWFDLLVKFHSVFAYKEQLEQDQED